MRLIFAPVFISSDPEGVAMQIDSIEKRTAIAIAIFFAFVYTLNPFKMFYFLI